MRFFRSRSILLAAAVLLFAVGCKRASESPSQTKGTPPAAQRVEFLAQNGLEGKVVLIEFGVIGCAMSESGLVTMAKMRDQGLVADLEYLRVEGSKESERTKSYFAAKAPSFPVRYDADHAITRVFDATVVPTFVLVGKFGRVRYRGQFPKDSELSGWVETVLAETWDTWVNAELFGVTKLDGPELLAATRIPDLTGSVKPLAEYTGRKGLLVMFVDTSCPFASQAMKEMPEVAAAFARQEIPSVLVNLDDPKLEVLPFYEKRKTGMRVLYDDTTATKERWAVISVPTVMLFDTEGAIVYRGKAVWKQLTSAAEKRFKLPIGSFAIRAEGTSYG